MLIHFFFDLLAMASGLLASLWFRRTRQLAHPAGIIQPSQYHYYLITLLLGLAAGSTIFGTLNLHLSGQTGMAKSMIGGIIGAIFAAEIFKFFSGIHRSTGLYFIPGLVILIVIGRIGCFLAGLPDFTYGVETSLPWGVDFGDGIRRHPVQLYESFAMMLFLFIFLSGYRQRPELWQRCGFYFFIFFYAAQRFAWEFIKPYARIYGGMNLFHLLSLCLMAYALVMLKWRLPHAA